MFKKTGYLDIRRLRQDGVPHWSDAPIYSIPGAMISYKVIEEFMGLGADLAANAVVPLASGNWWLTEANAVTMSQADVAGGVATLTCGGAAEDGGQVSLGGVQAGGGAIFCAAGKTIWFEVRASLTDIGTDQLNAFFGLINPNATEWLPDGGGGAMGVNDVIGWVLQDTEINWSFVGRRIAVENYVDCGAACDTTDGEYHYFGFLVDGITSVTAYFDRVAIAAGAQVTANIPITGLMPGFAIKAGNTNAEILSIDYIECVQLR